MKAVIKKQQSRLENSLVIYVNNKKQVNRMMLSLIESGFTVNYEPRYISGNYEGCILCGDSNKIKICCKQRTKKQKLPAIWDLSHRRSQQTLPRFYF